MVAFSAKLTGKKCTKRALKKNPNWEGAKACKNQLQTTQRGRAARTLTHGTWAMQVDTFGDVDYTLGMQIVKVGFQTDTVFRQPPKAPKFWST